MQKMPSTCHVEECMDDNELKVKKTQRLEIAKPVKWIVPDTLKVEHVTNLVVQQHNGEFTLYFFEVQQPFLTGSPEEQASQLQELPYIEARCIAKFMMSTPNAIEAEKVLRAQVDSFHSMFLESLNEAKNA
jgi:hypothetical protein